MTGTIDSKFIRHYREIIDLIRDEGYDLSYGRKAPSEIRVIGPKALGADRGKIMDFYAQYDNLENYGLTSVNARILECMLTEKSADFCVKEAVSVLENQIFGN